MNTGEPTLDSATPILIEQYENYHKQTIRNRCTIDSPNGRLHLTIPIDKGNFSGGKCMMKDVQISRHTQWQRQHWYALESSYYNSPYFEYLQDDFHPFYEREWTYLMDFNQALIAKCLELIDIHPQISLTDIYTGVDAPFVSNAKQYYQVFLHKHGFLNDLSIIDLLFNMGPEAILYIK